MRILHINNVANVGYTFVEGLKKLGHYAELRPLRLVAAKRSTLIKILVSPIRFREMLAVNRQVKSKLYDIIHIHFAYLGVFGIVGRYPYFLHCHGSDVRRDLDDPIRGWLIRQSLKKARAVFFVNPDLASFVRPIRSDAVFLPNPIHTSLFSPNFRPENRRPRILIISSLSPLKKVNVAFEAIRQLLLLQPEIQITAINQGPERMIYRNTPGVRFVAPVPYQSMPKLINDHDIVIGQFVLGALGMAELESLACGKPVICFFNYDDLYPHPPPVLSANQPEQVAEYLSTLVGNSALCRELGERGRDWVMRYHNYTTIAQRLEEIYQLEKPY